MKIKVTKIPNRKKDQPARRITIELRGTNELEIFCSLFNVTPVTDALHSVDPDFASKAHKKLSLEPWCHYKTGALADAIFDAPFIQGKAHRLARRLSSE